MNCRTTRHIDEDTGALKLPLPENKLPDPKNFRPKTSLIVTTPTTRFSTTVGRDSDPREFLEYKPAMRQSRFLRKTYFGPKTRAEIYIPRIRNSAGSTEISNTLTKMTIITTDLKRRPVPKLSSPRQNSFIKLRRRAFSEEIEDS